MIWGLWRYRQQEPGDEGSGEGGLLADEMGAPLLVGSVCGARVVGPHAWRAAPQALGIGGRQGRPQKWAWCVHSWGFDLVKRWEPGKASWCVEPCSANNEIRDSLDEMRAELGQCLRDDDRQPRKLPSTSYSSRHLPSACSW